MVENKTYFKKKIILKKKMKIKFILIHYIENLYKYNLI